MTDPALDPVLPTAPQVFIVPHCWDCGGSLRMLLDLCGYSAEIVRGADNAVRRALEALPSVVLVDVNLPDGDGRDLGRRLRQALGPGVRLIAMFGYGWLREPPGLADAGFDDWLHKPIEPEKLFDRIAIRPARRARPGQSDR